MCCKIGSDFNRTDIDQSSNLPSICQVVLKLTLIKKKNYLGVSCHLLKEDMRIKILLHLKKKVMSSVMSNSW